MKNKMIYAALVLSLALNGYLLAKPVPVATATNAKPDPCLAFHEQFLRDVIKGDCSVKSMETATASYLKRMVNLGYTHEQVDVCVNRILSK